ncbi:hypothetical protein GFS31_08490 [Leptolyngbya sp. BL0902]|nr:hypothetical protein GFS31_08490 [Leptolyngbya sp. BL0902]
MAQIISLSFQPRCPRWWKSEILETTVFLRGKIFSFVMV